MAWSQLSFQVKTGCQRKHGETCTGQAGGLHNSRVHRRKMFIHIFFGYNIKCCGQHFMVGKGEVGEMEACCTDF